MFKKLPKSVQRAIIATRRWIHRNKYVITATVGMAIAAIIFAVVSVWPQNYIEPVQRFNDVVDGVDADGTVGATQWRSVRFTTGDDFTVVILISIATGIVAAVVYQLLSTLVENKIKNAEEARFEQFFGRNAASHSQRGRILLQADDIEQLMSELLQTKKDALEMVREALDTPSNNRLFKARHWVNARDAEGARIVREGFRGLRFPAPELHIIERGTNAKAVFDAHVNAPYVISMGLGFTETRTEFEQLGKGDFKGKIVYVDQKTPTGDGLAVHKDVVHLYGDDPVELQEVNWNKELEDGFCWVSVKGWTLQAWRQPEGYTDYAVIARRVHADGKRKQVRLTLGGFTEDGTVAAAKYLVENWEALNQTLVTPAHARRPRDLAEADGEFVVLVSGKSRSKASWRDDRLIELGDEELRTRKLVRRRSDQ